MPTSEKWIYTHNDYSRARTDALNIQIIYDNDGNQFVKHAIVPKTHNLRDILLWFLQKELEERCRSALVTQFPNKDYNNICEHKPYRILTDILQLYRLRHEYEGGEEIYNSSEISKMKSLEDLGLNPDKEHVFFAEVEKNKPAAEEWHGKLKPLPSSAGTKKKKTKKRRRRNTKRRHTSSKRGRHTSTKRKRRSTKKRR